MCVKLYLTPLVDPRETEKVLGSQFAEMPEEPDYMQYENKQSTPAETNPQPSDERQLAARQGSFSVPINRLAGAGLNAEQPPPNYYRKSSGLSVETSAEDSQTPGDISIPDYRRLKVVRAEVNGQSNWEVSNDRSTALGVGFGAHSSR